MHPGSRGKPCAMSTKRTDQLAYKLRDAARALDVDELALAGLRDDGLLVTYRLGGHEYVTDHALRDLQHRLEVAHVQEKRGVTRVWAQKVREPAECGKG